MKTIKDYKHYLIIDLEATCCDQGSFPRREMEIIEIGAVMVEAKHLTIVDEFEAFVQPVRNPVLTEFCRQLTTINQDDVAAAPTFPDVVKHLAGWLDSYDDYLFCSWGDYDRKQIQTDCNYHDVSYPIGSTHLNIKKQFSDAKNTKKKYGLDKALKSVGLSFQGTHHRGIDDARNMARLMPIILGRTTDIH